jgi:hypothetical protein
MSVDANDSIRVVRMSIWTLHVIVNGYLSSDLSEVDGSAATTRYASSMKISKSHPMARKTNNIYAITACLYPLKLERRDPAMTGQTFFIQFVSSNPSVFGDDDHNSDRRWSRHLSSSSFPPPPLASHGKTDVLPPGSPSPGAFRWRMCIL